MAINKLMMAALKALSYAADFDVKKNYKADRVLEKLTHPALKPLYCMWDHKVAAADGYEIPVRVFEPQKRRCGELLLFFHGGGWVSGDIDSYIKPCAALADETGRRVASVDYRRAPEYPFPCAVEDCYQVARAIYLDVEALRALDERICLVGDSAGGNIAAAVSLMARDRGEFQVGRQILIYPATYDDHSPASPFPSIVENGTDYLLTSKKICDYIDLYVPDPAQRKSPYFAPLLAASLKDQPESLVVTAQYDPLRDEGEAYARALAAAGNTVTLRRMADALHGFFSLPVTFPLVRDLFAVINQFLDEGAKSC